MVLGYGYATHLPPLVECVLKTAGPVLELGAGAFSTPVLHELCAKRGRRLITVEADRIWREQFGWMAGQHHDLVSGLEDLGRPDGPAALPERLSVALIDSGPASSRAPYFEQFAGRAEWLVCHDWGVANYRWPNPWGRFRVVRFYTELSPWTAVLGGFKGAQ